MLSKMEEYKLLKDVKTTFDEYEKNVNEFIAKHALDRLPFVFFQGFGKVLNGYLKIIEDDKSEKMANALKSPIYCMKARYHDEAVQKGAINEIKQIFGDYLHDLEQELGIQPQQIKEDEKTVVNEETDVNALFKAAVERVLDKREKEKAQEKKAKEKNFLEEIFGKTKL